MVAKHWRVAHAFDSSLPGWLVVLPRRHLLSLVRAGAAQRLTSSARCLSDVSRALERVTGCLKTYVMLFAEAEGFAHLHLHVVPADARSARIRERGPAIFARLGRPEHERVPSGRWTGWRSPYVPRPGR